MKTTRHHIWRVYLTAVLLLSLAGVACGSSGRERSSGLSMERAFRVTYTETNYDFNGGIERLIGIIKAQRNNDEVNIVNAERVSAEIDRIVIEGIVTVHSNFVFSQIIDGPADPPNERRVFHRAFWLQDQDAGIMVLYDEDYKQPDVSASDHPCASDGYDDTDFNVGLIQPGDRVKLSVARIQKYDAGDLPIITCFETDTDPDNPNNPDRLEIKSSGNPIYYVDKKSDELKTTDLGKMVSILGEVDSAPEYKQYGNNEGTYEFQADHQQSFLGVLRGITAEEVSAEEVSAEEVSAEDETRVLAGDETTWGFQLNYNVAARGRSSFDLDDGYYSYNLSSGLILRLYGPVFSPVYQSSELRLAIVDPILNIEEQ